MLGCFLLLCLEDFPPPTQWRWTIDWSAGKLAYWISAATTNIGSKKYNQQAGWRNVQMTKCIWIDGYGCSCCMKRFFQLLYRTVLHFRSLETHLRTWDTCRCSVYSKSPKDLQKREHLLYINMTNSELNCVQSSSLKDMHLFPSPEIRKASCVSHQWCIQAFLLCWTRRVICLSIVNGRSAQNRTNGILC